MFFNRGYKRVLTLFQKKQAERIKFGFNPVSIIITWFFVGLSPIAPGTVASLSVYPIYNFLIISSTSYEELGLGFWVLAILFCIIGWIAIAKFQAKTFTHDYQAIVIDEIVGQLLTFGIAIKPLLKLGVVFANYFSMSAATLSFFIGVIAFRFFDIKKPFFIKTVDRVMKGSFAVILDDILAAIFAGLSIIVIYQIYDGVLSNYF